MEAATKNKRGRPKKHKYAEIVFSECERRTAQNIYYAGLGAEAAGQGYEGSFFVTSKGNFIRQGIAEQLGRLKEDETVSDEDILELAKLCIQDFNNGTPVKEIEKCLRTLRRKLKEGTLS